MSFIRARIMVVLLTTTKPASNTENGTLEVWYLRKEGWEGREKGKTE